MRLESFYSCTLPSNVCAVQCRHAAGSGQARDEQQTEVKGYKLHILLQTRVFRVQFIRSCLVSMHTQGQ